MLSGPEVGAELLDGEGDHVRVRVQMLVDGRADDDGDVLTVRYGLRLSRHREPSGREHALEGLGRVRLLEGHLARPDGVDRRRVPVHGHYREATVGEGDPERKAHPAAPADDG